MHVDAYIRQLTACRAHDVAGRLGEITAPTLVIHGDADPLVRIENGRFLAENIPGAELIVYEGIGHIPEVECYERFNEDLLAFLCRDLGRRRRGGLRRRPDRRPGLPHVGRRRRRPGGGPDRAARPRQGHARLHDVAGLQQEARADRAGSARRDGLPRARARQRAGTLYVLAQGTARVIERPVRRGAGAVCAPTPPSISARRRRVAFWDRWLREYYVTRVPVEVTTTRMLTWPTLDAAGAPRRRRRSSSARAAVAAEERHRPADRRRPAPPSACAATAHTCSGSRAPTARRRPAGDARRHRRARHRAMSAADPPPGGRRAGLLGHSYRPQLIGLETRQYTGWLEVDAAGRARYAPHTGTATRRRRTRRCCCCSTARSRGAGRRAQHARRSEAMRGRCRATTACSPRPAGRR